MAFHLLRGFYFRIQHADRQMQQVVEKDKVLRLALAKQQDKASSLDPAAPVSEPAVDVTAGIPIDELAALWDVEEKSICFEPRQSTYNQGDPGDAIYIILSSSVEIDYGTGEDRFVLFRVNPGDLFSESENITDSTFFRSWVRSSWFRLSAPMTFYLFAAICLRATTDASLAAVSIQLEVLHHATG